MKNFIRNAHGALPSWLSSKTFQVMRNAMVIIIISVFQVYAADAYSQEGELSLKMEQETLKTVFRAIEEKTDYTFLYNSKLVDDTRKVNASFDSNEIEEVLAVLFRGTDVQYQVIDRQIILTRTGALSGLQPGQVTGTVLDENGNPLPGVTIYFKGTSAGTVTNMNGQYTIDRPDDARVIVFSSVGYTTQEIEIGDRIVIDVQLNEDVHGLEEVIVIGYGSQVKKNLSSSVASVDAEKIATAPLASFEAGLEGRAAGVQITTAGAMSGSAVRVRIRGTSSVSANSDPLYVIDGIPVESGGITSSAPGRSIREWNLQQAEGTNVLASLNPSDIASIEVLKDAAAAAIYGSRGANGVVLISTKKGSAGKTKISASATYGLSNATHRIPMLDADQYMLLAQEAWTNMYKQGEQLVAQGEDVLGNWFMDRYDTINSYEKWWQESGVLVDGLTREEALKTDTDWIDEVLQTGSRQEYNVSAAGGSEKTVFFISANLKDENSILRGNEYLRFGSRVNIEHQLTKRFRVGAKMMLSHIDDQQVATSWAGGAGSVYNMLPIWPVRKEDGSYFYLNEDHPVAGIDLRDINLRSNQVLGTWFLNANIVEGLTFRTEFGANLLTNDDFHYRDGRITTHGRTVSATVIGNRSSWNWKNVLNYKKHVNNHGIDVLVATESQRFRRRENNIVGDTYFNSALQKPSDAAINQATYTESGYSFLSYIGRVNYDFKSRYLISASMRADGSSRFAVNNRWGYFPAASVGYILSEENYFRPLKKVFNFMKIRASYGIVGNAEIGNYAYYSSYSTVRYLGSTGILLDNLGDDQLGWESTAQLDVGLSWETFDGRLSGEFDYYDKLTTNLLLPYPVSGMTGVSTVTKNIGELSNKGFEIMLNSVNIRKNNFTWETNVTMARNINKVERLSDELGEGLTGSQGLGSIAIFPGHPVGVQELPEWSGVDPETGEDTYIDLDGNQLLYSEIIDEYGSFPNFRDVHKRPIGNPWPILAGGIDNRLTFKDFYMNVLFTYAYGQERTVGASNQWTRPFGSVKFNTPTYMLQRWQETGDVTPVSKVTLDNIVWGGNSKNLYRTDYIRLKDLTVGYRFYSEGSSLISGFNIFVKFTNLWTLTTAPDFFWDPEYNTNSGNTGTLGSFRASPQARWYLLGLTLDF